MPLCTLVHRNRGPTPRNHPKIPSVRYINFNPVNTDEVSNIGAPGFTVDVDGEDVDINLVDCTVFGAVSFIFVWCFPVVEGPAGAVAAAAAATEVARGTDVPNASGLCCVWVLVFTTSSGQVITPAMPPAVVAVRISNGNPMSLLPTHFFASFCSCS